MKILAIETSCDETAISIINARGGFSAPKFTILSNQLFSQASIHAKYGGVFPKIAKREHSKSLVPLLNLTLEEAKLLTKTTKPLLFSEKEELFYQKTLSHEYELLDQFLFFIKNTKKPKIDAIAVTAGPGLEPALWVGINFAKALSHAWDIPIVPVNHMEGHIMASLLDKSQKDDEVSIPKVNFPVLALLISGGHTELVIMKDWLTYKILGSTRDDAVGEAYDKVARMLKMPYPGGPHISELSESVPDGSSRYKLPRPMLHSDDFDFSFSGLKTAVLYTVKKIPRLTKKIKAEIANEFENAVVEVLLKKTMRAAQKYKVKTVLIGGGVSANKRIREQFKNNVAQLPNTDFYVPKQELSTDNGLMIAVSAYFRSLAYLRKEKPAKANILKEDKKKAALAADGNLSL